MKKELLKTPGKHVSLHSELLSTGQTVGTFNLKFCPLAAGPGIIGIHEKDDPVNTKEKFGSNMLTAYSFPLKGPLSFAFFRWYLQMHCIKKRL